MRNLALILVLANLAFAAWHAWFAVATSAPPVVVTSRSTAPEIVLVSELSDTPASSPRLPAAFTGSSEDASARVTPASTDGAGDRESPTPSVPLRCVSVGPFRELSQAATAAATLRSAGYAPVQRVGEGDIWIGYWVYLAGIDSEARAEELLLEVRQHGISDSYITPGANGYLISLGVFSEIGRAGARREQVRALGHEPALVDRTRRGTVYWVDLELPTGQALDLESLQTPGRITRLEQRPCDA